MTLDELVAKAIVQHRLALAMRLGSTSLTEFFPPDFDDAKLDELERDMNEGLASAARLLAIFSTVLEAIACRKGP
jgi:hypothetical protein